MRNGFLSTGGMSISEPAGKSSESGKKFLEDHAGGVRIRGSAAEKGEKG
jgi:hypothetical protein